MTLFGPGVRLTFSVLARRHFLRRRLRHIDYSPGFVCLINLRDSSSKQHRVSLPSVKYILRKIGIISDDSQTPSIPCSYLKHCSRFR